MKRFFREDDGDLYDRKKQTWIVVRRERRVSQTYEITDTNGERHLIQCDDVEERR